MDTLLDFFKAIGDIIVAIVDFVVSFFQDFIYLITLVAQVVQDIPLYFSWMPTTLVALLGVIFSLVAIFKILGREG